MSCFTNSSDYGNSASSRCTTFPIVRKKALTPIILDLQINRSPIIIVRWNYRRNFCLLSVDSSITGERPQQFKFFIHWFIVIENCNLFCFEFRYHKFCIALFLLPSLIVYSINNPIIVYLLYLIIKV